MKLHFPYKNEASIPISRGAFFSIMKHLLTQLYSQTIHKFSAAQITNTYSLIFLLTFTVNISTAKPKNLLSPPPRIIVEEFKNTTNFPDSPPCWPPPFIIAPWPSSFFVDLSRFFRSKAVNDGSCWRPWRMDVGCRFCSEVMSADTEEISPTYQS